MEMHPTSLFLCKFRYYYKIYVEWFPYFGFILQKNFWSVGFQTKSLTIFFFTQKSDNTVLLQNKTSWTYYRIEEFHKTWDFWILEHVWCSNGEWCIVCHIFVSSRGLRFSRMLATFLRGIVRANKFFLCTLFLSHTQKRSFFIILNDLCRGSNVYLTQ